MPEYDGRTFDRREQFDERSRAFDIRAAVASLTPRSYTWACQAHLDQGREGACVGFGWSHELAARPKEVAGVTNNSALNLYHAAQEVDEWPGHDYEGTSVLAGAKAVQAEGFMPEYRWAFNTDDVVLTLGYHGPVVFGVPWLDTMMDPDPTTHFLDCSGKPVGGHCLLGRGVSLKLDAILLHNSWGIDWGMFGCAFIKIADLDRLLHDGGESCIPVRRVKQP